MNIPMSWLNQYVDLTDINLKDYIHKITMTGTKVELVTEVSKEIINVVVGKILKIEKHPDADKLLICQVDVGDEKIQIVTGATNVFEGAIIPVALVGAVLKNDLKIKKGKLRGVESNGMLCSVSELGFDNHDYPEAPEDGIYIFQTEEKLGDNVVEVLKMRDDVVEYELTSNRPDCYSVIGIAREAAATFDKKFNYPEIKVKEEIKENINDLISVKIENEELCSRYTARVIKNVKIETSPLWLRNRLTMSGIKPINNIVDITNYVLLELGQPMHAFNIDLVEDKKIIVRNAKPNEKIITLDGVERILDESILVIADTKKPLAIAGIIGGENTKVTNDSKTILLESACFDGTRTRLSSKKIGIRTDSSGKFEKGLDPNLAIEGINRAAQLIEELGYGNVVEGVVDIYPKKIKPWSVKYSSEKINNILGINISNKEMENIFSRLGLKAKDNTVYIETFRQDLLDEADLSEEVARIFGYEKIVPTLFSGTPTVGKRTRNQNIEMIIKNTLVSQGMFEIMNYSFESPKVFDKLLIDEKDCLRNAIAIRNPLGEDYSIMRTTSLNGILQSLSTNYNRRNEEAKLFELSYVYIPKSLPLTELPKEIITLTLGMYGDLDFYDLKGTIEELLKTLGMNNLNFSTKTNLNYMHPGRTGSIFYNDIEIGYLGEVHPNILSSYGIGTKSYIGILNVEKIYDLANLEKEYIPLGKYPAVKRDLAMVVDENILVKEIEDVIKKSAGKLLEEINLFDVYKGEQVGKGLKSVAYSFSLRDINKTLTEEEITNTVNKIIKNLEEKLNAKLRL